MELLYTPTSPFVRKVRVTLHETGLAPSVTLRRVNTKPLATDPALTGTNPIGKVPALIRPDGPTIYDSRVICRFLDARAGTGFYPESRVWEVLTMEATADAMLEASVLIVYEGRLRAEAMRSAEWMEHQWSKVARALDALEGQWMSHLAGPLHMGQIGVAVALGYLDFRHDARAWRASHPALAEWHAGFAQRESYVSTAPPEGA